MTPAEARGRLRVSDRAVARIAAAAATEVEFVHGSRAPRAGWWRRSARRDRLPRARARVTGQDARVALVVAVDYPTAVVDVCGALRDHVTARVAELAGIRVAAVDVTVPALRVRHGFAAPPEPYPIDEPAEAGNRAAP